MASWMVHLRIADKLLDRIEGLDRTAFVMGNIAPDSGVPNEDWTEYHPPKAISHFKTKPEDETYFDIEKFRTQYFCEETVKAYSNIEYSFFLGYYVHLLSDVEWTDNIYKALLAAYPDEAMKDKYKLVWDAKADWYDLDFLYLSKHPDFRAFNIYENAVGYDNEFMDMFAVDAFENRRQYICGFYRSDNHGDLHREFTYLTPAQAERFVDDTVNKIMNKLAGK